MNRKDKQKRHTRRVHEQHQHSVRRLTKDINQAVAECKIILKRRKKSVDTGLAAEMEKRGFVSTGAGWDRA